MCRRPWTSPQTPAREAPRGERSGLPGARDGATRRSRTERSRADLRRASERRRQTGTSLMELLVVAMLLSFMAVAVMKIGPEMFGSTSKLTARARTINELRAAAEMILQDMGGAEDVSWMNNERLSITREEGLATWLGAWVPGPGDAGVQYELEEHGLVRTDLALGTTLVVAREIDVFTVDKTGNARVTIGLGAGEDPGEHSLTLIWEN